MPLSALGSATGLNQGVDLLRQVEVEPGESALAVGGKAEEDLVPADVDVRVVIGLFGQDGHGVDELQGGGKVGECELAGDFAAGSLPGVEAGGFFGNFFCSEAGGHGRKNSK